MLEVSLLPVAYGFASNSYLISSNGEYAVVDPSSPFKNFDSSLNLKYILLTHVHFDHMLFIEDWVENTGAEVIVSVCDAEALSDSNKNCYKLFFNKDLGYQGTYRAVSDGETLLLGDTSVYVHNGPGHTPGSLIYMADNFIFSGDIVFAGGGYGRCDLPGGNYNQLIRTIDMIIQLPPDTVIYPGHGSQTTVEQYKKYYRL